LVRAPPKMPIPSRGGYVTLEVRIVPETQIIAPVVTKEQRERWVRKGWMKPEVAEHLDRGAGLRAPSPQGGLSRGTRTGSR